MYIVFKEMFFQSSKMSEGSVRQLVVLVDESGSMNVQRDAIIEAVNSYLETLQKSGVPIHVSLYTFTIEHKKVKKSCFLEVQILNQKKKVAHGPIEQVRLSSETYNPDGGTALFDAIRAIIPECVNPLYTVVIATDGEDQDSKTSSAFASGVIECAKRNGTKVIYIAQGDGAIAVGHALGINDDYTIRCKNGQDLSQAMGSQECAEMAYYAMDLDPQIEMKRESEEESDCKRSRTQ